MKLNYITPEIEVVEYQSEEMIAASIFSGGGNENHGEQGQQNSTGDNVGGTGEDNDFDQGTKPGGFWGNGNWGFALWSRGDSEIDYEF